MFAIITCYVFRSDKFQLLNTFTMKKLFLSLLVVILCACLFGFLGTKCLVGCQKAKTDPTLDCSQFVTLTDAVPDAILEIRYFSTYNFVGARIDGYLEPTALLTKTAADSLRAVSDELKALGYRLKIYDAYRPQKAVDHFVRWAADLPDTLMRQFFYSDLDKSVLFDQEYICAKSGHTPLCSIPHRPSFESLIL